MKNSHGVTEVNGFHSTVSITIKKKCPGERDEQTEEKSLIYDDEQNSVLRDDEGEKNQKKNVTAQSMKKEKNIYKNK